MRAQLGSSVAFGSGCGQALPGVPRAAQSDYMSMGCIARWTARQLSAISKNQQSGSAFGGNGPRCVGSAAVRMVARLLGSPPHSTSAWSLSNDGAKQIASGEPFCFFQLNLLHLLPKTSGVLRWLRAQSGNSCSWKRQASSKSLLMRRSPEASPAVGTYARSAP